MHFLPWCGVFFLIQGSSSTRYLLDNEREIVTPTDLPWNNQVYVMEIDRRNPGFIIVSDHVKMQTVSRDGKSKSVIVGADGHIGYSEGVGQNATFNRIASFVQLNESLIVVADTDNHCLRSINREALNATTPFSGRCNSSGYQDGGSLTNTRYSNPYGLALSGNKLFVADNNNDAIRIVDILSMVVSTLLSKDERLIKPRYILLDSAGFMLVSLQNGGFVNASTTSGVLTLLTSQQPGYKDGPLTSATFRELTGMSWMDPNVAVVSDFGNNRIRIVDLAEGNVSTLCKEPTRDGSNNDCTFQGVFSVFVVDKKIYVSGSSYVKEYEVLRRGELEENGTIVALLVDVSSTSATTAMSSILPSGKTAVSGGILASSALLPGIVSGAVVVLALAFAI